jgi:hypothetical protein
MGERSGTTKIQKMKNYIIPYQERFVKLNYISSQKSVLCVDNLGLVVYHNTNDDLSPENIRRYLVGVKSFNTVLVQAENLPDALSEFYSYPETTTGFKHKAWEIEDSGKRPIIEYSSCCHLKSEEELSGLFCQYYAMDGEFDQMLCILDGSDDPPKECPILKNQTRDRIEVRQIGGIWVKTFHKNCKPTSIGINGLKLSKITSQ